MLRHAYPSGRSVSFLFCKTTGEMRSQFVEKQTTFMRILGPIDEEDKAKLLYMLFKSSMAVKRSSRVTRIDPLG